MSPIDKGQTRQAQPPPPVGLLLDIDADYRPGAEAGQLRRITPRRLNPCHDAWLPILHVEREGWDFTALYSNSARAHQVGALRDWVIIFFNQGGQEDQSTVVTEKRGPLLGHRVVREREGESLAYDAAKARIVPALFTSVRN